jgi:hypothetical protein
MRLKAVRPPVPHSIGSPVACSLRHNSRRVAFTAAASLGGWRACGWTSGCPNSAAVLQIAAE